MPLKVDEIFPDTFPNSLNNLFVTFQKLRDRSLDVINLDRIEFDDPSYLLYLFKGEYAIIDPNLTKIKYVGSDLAINSLVLIIKDPLSGVFAFIHIGQEYEFEECLSEVVIKIISMAQKLRLAMMEPILEISIFGGFSCNIDLEESIGNKRYTPRGVPFKKVASLEEDRTFSIMDDAIAEEVSSLGGDTENNDSSNRLNSKNQRKSSGIEQNLDEAKGDDDGTMGGGDLASSFLLINESEALTMRLLRAFYTSKIIFDLVVLCAGKINTEVIEIPPEREDSESLKRGSGSKKSLDSPLYNSGEEVTPDRSRKMTLPNLTSKKPAPAVKAARSKSVVSLFSNLRLSAPAGKKKKNLLSSLEEHSPHLSIQNLSPTTDAGEINDANAPTTRIDDVGLPHQLSEGRTVRSSSIFGGIRKRLGSLTTVGSVGGSSNSSVATADDFQSYKRRGRRRTSSIVKLVTKFVASKFSHADRRIYHAPRLSAVAYEIESASYFPVSRFLIPTTPSAANTRSSVVEEYSITGRQSRDYFESASSFIRAVDYNMAMIAPNWVPRFARTCVPMLISSGLQMEFSPLPYVFTNQNGVQLEEPQVAPYMKVLQVYDNSNKSTHYYGRHSDDTNDIHNNSYLTVTFGSTKQFLRDIYIMNHNKKLSTQRRITLSNISSVANDPQSPYTNQPTDKNAKEEEFKDMINLEIEMKEATKRLNYLLETFATPATPLISTPPQFSTAARHSLTDLLQLKGHHHPSSFLFVASEADIALIETYLYPESLNTDSVVTRYKETPEKLTNTNNGDELNNGSPPPSDDDRIISCALEYLKRVEEGDTARRLAQEIREALKFLRFDLSSPSATTSHTSRPTSPTALTPSSPLNGNPEEFSELGQPRQTFVCYDLDDRGRWNIVLNPCLSTTI